jgi:predicted GNAT superfamily acetyltransferase
MSQAEIRIRRAVDLQDYQACVDLQKAVWGFTEAIDMAALPLLVVGNRLGGAVLVALDAAEKYVGFSYALLGKEPDGRQVWWSHMTAVLSEYRNRDVGLQLKLAQRQEALNQGIDEIHWTFDPLQSVNGHFNIRKLGTIVTKYEENIYGLTSSALHHGLPTDRLVAEWKLSSDRVRQIVDSPTPPVVLRDLDRIPVINPGGGDPRLDQEDEQMLVEIPATVAQLDATAIAQWQRSLKLSCRHCFKAGYAITDFIKLDGAPPQTFYLLSRTSAL